MTLLGLGNGPSFAGSNRGFGGFFGWGTERTINGGFTTDSDWSTGAGWTISGEKANADTAGSELISQGGLFTVGLRYKLEVEITSYTAGALQVQCGGQVLGSGNSAGTLIYDFIAEATPVYLYALGASELSIDNVSIKEWEYLVVRTPSPSVFDPNQGFNPGSPPAGTYVKTTGSDTTGDGSYDTPYYSIKHAITNLKDASGQVWVEGGDYNYEYSASSGMGLMGDATVTELTISGYGTEKPRVYAHGEGAYAPTFHLEAGKNIIENINFMLLIESCSLDDIFFTSNDQSVEESQNLFRNCVFYWAGTQDGNWFLSGNKQATTEACKFQNCELYFERAVGSGFHTRQWFGGVVDTHTHLNNYIHSFCRQAIYQALAPNSLSCTEDTADYCVAGKIEITGDGKEDSTFFLPPGETIDAHIVGNSVPAYGLVASSALADSNTAWRYSGAIELVGGMSGKTITFKDSPDASGTQIESAITSLGATGANWTGSNLRDYQAYGAMTNGGNNWAGNPWGTTFQSILEMWYSDFPVKTNLANAGDPNETYNNLDATRNHVGSWGGREAWPSPTILE